MIGYETKNDGDVWIHNNCHVCGKFVKVKSVLINGLGEVKAIGICKKHGEQKLDHEFI